MPHDLGTDCSACMQKWWIIHSEAFLTVFGDHGQKNSELLFDQTVGSFSRLWSYI